MKTNFFMPAVLLLIASVSLAQERDVPRLAALLGVSAATSKTEIMLRFPNTKCQAPSSDGYQSCIGSGLALFERVSTRTAFLFLGSYLHGVTLEWPSEGTEPSTLSREIGTKIAEHLGVEFDLGMVSIDPLEPQLKVQNLYWANLLKQHISLHYCPRRTKLTCVGSTANLHVLMFPESSQ
jgi:hypothetical protein